MLLAASYFIANGINNWLPTLHKTVYHLRLQEALPLGAKTWTRWNESWMEKPTHE